MLLTGLVLGLAGCPRQVPESPRGVDTLVLSYQTPEQRQAVQDALKELGLSYKMNLNAGGKAEYAVEISEAVMAQSLDGLAARLPAFMIQRREQRLLLICCK